MRNYLVSYLYTRTGRNVEIKAVQAGSPEQATSIVAAEMRAAGTKWPRGAVIIADAA